MPRFTSMVRSWSLTRTVPEMGVLTIFRGPILAIREKVRVSAFQLRCS